MKNIGGLIGDILLDPEIDAKNFYKLVQETDKPLYHGCEKFYDLSFIIKIMHMKYIND